MNHEWTDGKEMNELFYLIVGALSTIAGASLTQHLYNKNQTNIFEREEKNNKEKRYFWLKQKSISYTLDTISKIMIYYASLPQKQDFNENELIKELTNIDIALNKIHIYCDTETIKSAHRIATTLQKILMEAMQDKRDILDLNEEALPETDKINLQTSQLTNKVQENLTIINHLIKDFYITIRKELSSPVNILNFREIMDDYIHNISEPSKTALRK